MARNEEETFILAYVEKTKKDKFSVTSLVHEGRCISVVYMSYNPKTVLGMTIVLSLKTSSQMSK